MAFIKRVQPKMKLSKNKTEDVLNWEVPPNGRSAGERSRGWVRSLHPPTYRTLSPIVQSSGLQHVSMYNAILISWSKPLNPGSRAPQCG